jgi:hypothetical protein
MLLTECLSTGLQDPPPLCIPTLILQHILKIPLNLIVKTQRSFVLNEFHLLGLGTEEGVEGAGGGRVVYDLPHREGTQYCMCNY